jgi:hypothetical protein
MVHWAQNWARVVPLQLYSYLAPGVINVCIRPCPVVPAWLLYESNSVRDFILRVHDFIVSVRDFILRVHNFILHEHVEAQ